MRFSLRRRPSARVCPTLSPPSSPLGSTLHPYSLQTAVPCEPDVAGSSFRICEEEHMTLQGSRTQQGNAQQNKNQQGHSESKRSVEASRRGTGSGSQQGKAQKPKAPQNERGSTVRKGEVAAAQERRGSSARPYGGVADSTVAVEALAWETAILTDEEGVPLSPPTLSPALLPSTIASHLVTSHLVKSAVTDSNPVALPLVAEPVPDSVSVTRQVVVSASAEEVAACKEATGQGVGAGGEAAGGRRATEWAGGEGAVSAEPTAGAFAGGDLEVGINTDATQGKVQQKEGAGREGGKQETEEGEGAEEEEEREKGLEAGEAQGEEGEEADEFFDCASNTTLSPPVSPPLPSLPTPPSLPLALFLTSAQDWERVHLDEGGPWPAVAPSAPGTPQRAPLEVAGVVTPPLSTVTPPPSTVKPPPGAVTPQPGAVTPPPGAVTPPPGAVTPPNGAVTLPPASRSGEEGEAEGSREHTSNRRNTRHSNSSSPASSCTPSSKSPSRGCAPGIPRSPEVSPEWACHVAQMAMAEGTPPSGSLSLCSDSLYSDVSATVTAAGGPSGSALGTPSVASIGSGASPLALDRDCPSEFTPYPSFSDKHQPEHSSTHPPYSDTHPTYSDTHPSYGDTHPSYSDTYTHIHAQSGNSDSLLQCPASYSDGLGVVEMREETESASYSDSPWAVARRGEMDSGRYSDKDSPWVVARREDMANRGSAGEKAKLAANAGVFGRAFLQGFLWRKEKRGGKGTSSAQILEGEREREKEGEKEGPPVGLRMSSSAKFTKPQGPKNLLGGTEIRISVSLSIPNPRNLLRRSRCDPRMLETPVTAPKGALTPGNRALTSVPARSLLEASSTSSAAEAPAGVAAPAVTVPARGAAPAVTVPAGGAAPAVPESAGGVAPAATGPPGGAAPAATKAQAAGIGAPGVEAPEKEAAATAREAAAAASVNAAAAVLALAAMTTAAIATAAATANAAGGPDEAAPPALLAPAVRTMAHSAASEGTTAVVATEGAEVPPLPMAVPCNTEGTPEAQLLPQEALKAVPSEWAHWAPVFVGPPRGLLFSNHCIPEGENEGEDEGDEEGEEERKEGEGVRKEGEAEVQENPNPPATTPGPGLGALAPALTTPSGGDMDSALDARSLALWHKAISGAVRTAGEEQDGEGGVSLGHASTFSMEQSLLMQHAYLEPLVEESEEELAALGAAATVTQRAERGPEEGGGGGRLGAEGRAQGGESVERGGAGSVESLEGRSGEGQVGFWSRLFSKRASSDTVTQGPSVTVTEGAFQKSYSDKGQRRSGAVVDLGEGEAEQTEGKRTNRRKMEGLKGPLTASASLRRSSRVVPVNLDMVDDVGLGFPDSAPPGSPHGILRFGA